MATADLSKQRSETPLRLPPADAGVRAEKRFLYQAGQRFDALIGSLGEALHARLGAVADDAAHRVLTGHLTEALVDGEAPCFQDRAALASYALRRLKPRSRCFFDALLAPECRGLLAELLQKSARARSAERGGEALRVVSLGGGPGFDAAATRALLAALVDPAAEPEALRTPLDCEVLDLAPDWEDAVGAMKAAMADAWAVQSEEGSGSGSLSLVAPVDLRCGEGSSVAAVVAGAVERADIVIAAYVIHENEAALVGDGMGTDACVLRGCLPSVFRAARPDTVLVFLDATHRLWPAVITTAAAEHPGGFEVIIPGRRTSHIHALILIRRSSPCASAAAASLRAGAELAHYGEHQRLHRERLARKTLGASHASHASPGAPAALGGVVDSFLTWCCERGLERPGVAIESKPGRGLCMVTTCPCVRGGRLVLAPGDALIAEGVDGDYAASHWMIGLVHRLLEEDSMGSCSPYAPWVALLFEDNEPQDLAAWSDLPGFAGRRARFLAAQRERIVAELLRALPGATVARAHQALHAVNSRSLYSKEARARALVPFFHFMNHDARPNACWSMGAGRSVEISALRDIGVGEEVTICYDELPNTSLLLTYGFVLEGQGPHKAVDLEVSLSPADGGALLGAADDAPRADVRLLADGAVARRAVLGPLLADARQRCAGGLGAEVLLATALRRCARGEREAWISRAREDDDGRLVLLGRCCAEVLGNFLVKIEAWLEDPAAEPLMRVLSRGPEPELPSSGESSSSSTEDSE